MLVCDARATNLHHGYAAANPPSELPAARPQCDGAGNPLFWIGYACLFLGEVATVLINEVVDFPSDRNKHFRGDRLRDHSPCNLAGVAVAQGIESGKPPGRIDGLMAASLTYVLWFGLFPLFKLAG